MFVTFLVVIYVLCLSCFLVFSLQPALWSSRVYVKLSSVFVAFPCGVLSRVWYLIVSIPDLCCLTYFYVKHEASVNYKLGSDTQ